MTNQSETRAPGARCRHGERVLVWLFWLFPLTFYLATVSRTPGWVDAPLIANVVHRLGLSAWVNNHNLFTLLGYGWLWLTPHSVDPHHALNVLCAGLGALTVYLAFLIGLRLTNNTFASVLGAFVLMVSHSLWWHSTMLEVYTLSTVLLCAVVLFVIRSEQRGSLADLCVAAFAYGLACSNHLQMVFLGIGFVGLFIWSDSRVRLLRPKALLLVTLCFLAGFQIYLWVLSFELAERFQWATEVETPRVILRTTLERATGGDFKQYMFPLGLSMRDRLFWWAFYIGLFIYNLPLPWILFAPVGLLAWWKNRVFRASLGFFILALLAQIAWSANYLVWDMYAFALPAYVMSGVLIVLGIDWTWRRSARLRVLVCVLAPTILLVPVMYAKAPTWIAESPATQRFLSMLPQYSQAKAFWDPLDYFFNPNKRSYDRVHRYAETILGELEPEACYWGNEATMLYPLELYYQDVLGRREDVSYHLVFGIMSSETKLAHHAATMIEQLQRGCPVYVSSLGYPEREVLNHVYRRLDDSADLADIARLPEAVFGERFPDYRLLPSSVDPSEGVKIYRLQKR